MTRTSTGHVIRYDALDLLPVRGALPALARRPGRARRRRARARRPAPARRPWCRWCWPGWSATGPCAGSWSPSRGGSRRGRRRGGWRGCWARRSARASASPCAGSGWWGHARAWRSSRPVCCCSGCSATRSWPGVDVVVLDECHERHLDADTVGGVPAGRTRAALRPELRLVAASATTDAEGWARLLGRGAGGRGGGGVASGGGGVGAAGASGAAAARHAGRPGAADACGVGGAAGACRAGRGRAVFPARGRGDRAGRRAARRARRRRGAPGARAGAGRRAGRGADSGGTRRRVVLATSVAESSLTVPGVRVVVDSGLAREPRVDHARGLSALTTVRASQAAGRQRAGRAGREAPGAVYRCWAEAEDGRLPRFPAPEIKVADLTAFALQAACWGDPGRLGAGAAGPAAGGCAGGGAGGADGDRRGGRGRAGHGAGRADGAARAASAAGAGAAGRGARGGCRRAAEVVALLSEEPPREYGDDLAAACGPPGVGVTPMRRGGVRRFGGCGPRGPRRGSPARHHG